MHAESAAMRLQDLFLILSQSVDLGLLAVAAAFGAAGDLKQVLGSGFEMIGVSQSKSARVFRVMIKKRQIGDQIDDHNIGAVRLDPEGSTAGT